MEWYAQLVLAEAVRRGALLLLDHPAAAPLAAGLAGGACHLARPGPRVVSHPGGFRAMLSPPSAAMLPPDALVVCAGQVANGVPTAALCLETSPSPGVRPWQPLVPELPRLLVGPRLPATLAEALRAFALDLISGRADPWDWIDTHLSSLSPVRGLSWSTPDVASLDLDPLGIALAQDRAQCLALVAAGRVKVTARAPATLRVPMLGASDATAMLQITAPGPVEVRPIDAPGQIEISAKRNADAHRVTIAPAAAPMWVDITISARIATLTSVALRLPFPGSADGPATDPLDQYGDPLDAYTSTGPA